MNRQLQGILVLPLLLASTLTFSAKAMAAARPDLCPTTDARGTATGTIAIIDAETSDRYFSICRDPGQGTHNYVSRLKSGGKTVRIPVDKSGFGWSSNSKNDYEYVVSTVSKKLFIYKSGKLTVSQSFLVYRLNKST